MWKCLTILPPKLEGLSQEAQDWARQAASHCLLKGALFVSCELVLCFVGMWLLVSRKYLLRQLANTPPSQRDEEFWRMCEDRDIMVREDEVVEREGCKVEEMEKGTFEAATGTLRRKWYS